jgi:2-haloacid dehalogenase
VIAAVRTRWVTFDCFGTLVDWEAGFTSILADVVGPKAREIVRAYHDHERLAEAERPHLSYKEVLSASLTRAADESGVALTRAQADALAEAWDSMPLFPDVERMLDELRGMGCRLAVLTNCDNDLFERTHRRFSTRFDLVVTAEQVCDYKPSLSHFRYFDRVSGVGVGDWVHVGGSVYHDIMPATKLGIRSVWLDRYDAYDDGVAPTARVRSALDVPRAVARM